MLLDDFRVRQARALGINTFLILFTYGREMSPKPETFMIFRETTMDSCSGEYEKHILVFFFSSKICNAILL